MKRRGSALIVTIFLLTAIGGTVLGLSKLLFSESTISSIYESGIVAYYGAESGIEEGFLRYRYDPDAEVPSDPMQYNNLDSYIRSNLTNSLSGVSGQMDLAKAYYELRLGSRVPTYGNVSKVSATSFSEPAQGDADYDNYGRTPAASGRILRDEAKKLRIDFSNNKDVNFYFRPVAPVFAPNANFLDDKYRCMLIEIKLTGKNGANLEEHKTILRNASGACGAVNDTIDASSRIDYSLTANGYGVINRFKSTSMLSNWSGFNDADTELYIKPIGADMIFAIEDSGDPTGVNYPIYGPYTRVESIGYYNGASRKLVANIDRQSGTLYDLFDYVIYKAADSSNPTPAPTQMLTLSISGCQDGNKVVKVNDSDVFTATGTHQLAIPRGQAVTIAASTTGSCVLDHVYETTPWVEDFVTNNPFGLLMSEDKSFDFSFRTP